MDCSQHKGHRHYVGGPLDGTTEHLVHSTPSDLPIMWSYPGHPNGIYESTMEGGTEVTYVWRECS